MDALGIERAHLLGFSMGGGVVLNVADIAPQRVGSITMLSAIGVQEAELLGDYHLNHALHGAQLAAIWSKKRCRTLGPSAIRCSGGHTLAMFLIRINGRCAKSYRGSRSRC